MPTGHCMRCKAKREMTNTKNTTTKRGQPMIQGYCVECGTKMAVFIARDK